MGSDNMGKMNFRRAALNDLEEILRLLSEDELGSRRELLTPGKIPAVYQAAFADISSDPNQALMVVERQGKIIGTCHLTFMPSLTFQGAKRMNIEAVRVDQSSRSQGIGAWMIEQSIKIAQKKMCKIVQLTTNKKRRAAKRFYEKLGFQASHEGMKLYL